MLDLSHYRGVEPGNYNTQFGNSLCGDLYAKYTAYKLAKEYSHDINKSDFTFSTLSNLGQEFKGSSYFRFGNQLTIYNRYDADDFM